MELTTFNRKNSGVNGVQPEKKAALTAFFCRCEGANNVETGF